MAQQERFHDLPLEEVIGDRFGRYSKYIIKTVRFQMHVMD